VVLGYFIFLFRASDKEYKEVIAEKFGDAPASVDRALRTDIQ